MVTAKVQYACLALIELGLQQGGDRLVQLRAIAEGHGIPSPFLVQIMQQLKNAGLVTSVRGASGGYRLAQDAQRISLAAIVEAIEGPVVGDEGPTERETDVARVVRNAWFQVSVRYREVLAETTLDQLIEQSSSAATMYHI
ncbi:MAG: Rrf2 family transcriptional regulator [Pirellulaceae bacterium]|nr:Rrf2 family transcriptional regulator [Planctomycetales bacterium]